MDRFEKLSRDKSVLVIHIAELRTEMMRIENESASTTIQELDYPALIEKFIDDEKILDLIPKIRTCSLEQCRHYVVDCLDELYQLRIQIQDVKDQEEETKFALAEYSRIELLEEELEQKSNQLTLQEKELNKTKQAFTAQLNVLEKEKDAKIKQLEEIVKNASEAEHMAIQTDPMVIDQDKFTPIIQKLEKDVFYYRSANRDLKAKLREVVSVNHKLAKSLEKDKEIPAPVRPAPSSSEQPQFAVAVEK